MGTVTLSRQSQGSSRPASSDEIVHLLDDLPPETLTVVKAFVTFLHEQAQQGRSVSLVDERPTAFPYAYPTILVPASAWIGLVGALPAVGGDALADTEAFTGDCQL